MALPALIDKTDKAQAVSPSKEIAFLFDNMIGNVQVILIMLATLVIIVAGIGMMVSIYNTMNERRQEIAIMRALGAKRTTVMAIILLESILLSLGGGFLGVLIGHGLIGIINPWISAYTGIVVELWKFQWSELILVPGLVILASIVGYLPAAVAYKQDVASSLKP
jgi:putative ABC transport system permease protein